MYVFCYSYTHTNLHNILIIVYHELFVLSSKLRTKFKSIYKQFSYDIYEGIKY